MNVLAFGEVLWDVYENKRVLGGAPLNFAAHLAKHGHDVSLVSAVGRDEEGIEAISLIEQWGIMTDGITVLDNKETGKCLVTLDDNAIPSYNLLQDVAYDYVARTTACNNKADVLYFGTLALRSEHNKASLKEILGSYHFSEIFVDLNIRQPFSTEDAVRFAISNATILKISNEELPFVANALKISDTKDYKTISKKISSLFQNLRCIVITLGDNGAYALDILNNIEGRCKANQVELVSTVGAGDSFSASFLHQYHQSTLDFALRYAARIAEFVVSNYEAVPDYSPDDFC